MMNFAVIGHPLGHSLSPALHTHVFHRLSLNASYQALDTPPERLAEVARQLRQGDLAGINITLPHKTAFIEHLDLVAPDAVPAGAVNCVVVDQERLIGHNTDITGIQYALRQAQFQASGSSALVIGAGGGGRAVVAALLLLGAGHICVVDCREPAVKSLLANFQEQAGSTTLEGRLIQSELDTAPYQLLVNATPVGMWPRTGDSPLETYQIHGRQTVFDLVYHPEKTLLLRRAFEQGCRTVTGLDMFIAQGLASLEHWFPGVIYNEVGELNPGIELAALKAVLSAAIEDHASGASTASQTGETT
ncbi:MAG: shikimate dehydrogenase [Fidelibacterota bacterium]|nr:MAG: shikimate dehydrogenase [Candidatus Neomarinimicrobiota bacterium]